MICDEYNHRANIDNCISMKSKLVDASSEMLIVDENFQKPIFSIFLLFVFNIVLSFRRLVTWLDEASGSHNQHVFIYLFY